MGQAQGANWRRRLISRLQQCRKTKFLADFSRVSRMTRAGRLYPNRIPSAQAAYRGLFQGDIYAARDQICYTGRFLSHA